MIRLLVAEIFMFEIVDADGRRTTDADGRTPDHGYIIVYPWSGVRPSASVVRRPSASTISNMNISATNRRITMKFYQKHHWDGGKAALGFWPDRIGTLVTMATESSHRLIMEKTVLPLFLSCFSSDPFYTCR